MIRDLVRDVPVLRHDQLLGDALRTIIERGLPALPVTEGGRYVGVLGEREVLGRVFPGYLKTLSYAGFVPDALDEAIERRRDAVAEPVGKLMYREHVDLPSDASSTALAEVFLHHDVVVVPVVDAGHVRGVVTRADFFRLVAEQLLAR